MAKFLVLFDGEIFKTDEIMENDLEYADKHPSELKIISIEGTQPTQYRKGNWYGIDVWEDV